MIDKLIPLPADENLGSKVTLTTGATIGIVLGITVIVLLPIAFVGFILRKKLSEKYKKKSHFSPNPFYFKW